MTRALLFGVTAVVMLTVQQPAKPVIQVPCSGALPSPFVPMSKTLWRGPWVFAGMGSPATVPLPGIDNATRPQHSERLRPIPFKLDDGSTGSIAAQLAPPDVPTPDGMIQDYDSFW